MSSGNTNTEYTTKVTAQGSKWLCGVYKNDKLLVHSVVNSREEIGNAFQDMLRMIDKSLGGDEFTDAARHRVVEGRVRHSVKLAWNDRNKDA